jgi:hypothetical protein
VCNIPFMFLHVAASIIVYSDGVTDPTSSVRCSRQYLSVSVFFCSSPCESFYQLDSGVEAIKRLVFLRHSGRVTSCLPLTFLLLRDERDLVPYVSYSGS